MDNGVPARQSHRDARTRLRQYQQARSLLAGDVEALLRRSAQFAMFQTALT